jgi:hypothetical protein
MERFLEMLHVVSVCGSEGCNSPLYLRWHSLHSFGKCGFY